MCRNSEEGMAYGCREGAQLHSCAECFFFTWRRVCCVYDEVEGIMCGRIGMDSVGGRHPLPSRPLPFPPLCVQSCKASGPRARKDPPSLL